MTEHNFVAEPKEIRRPPPPETYWQKTVRKCSAEPFVPIGGLATAVVLMFGLRSFVNKETKRSQYWMRARVIAQGFTVLAVALGSNFIKPNHPKTYEEVMDRQVEKDKEDEWRRDDK